MSDYEFDDVDPAAIEAIAARVDDLAAAVHASERQRRHDIAELGKVAGLPKLAAKLVREGISASAAFRRLRASQRRREAARKVEIETGWSNAIAKLNGEKIEKNVDPVWDAAIKRAFPHG